MAPVNEPLTATQVARIAIYDDLLSAPRIVEIEPADVATYIDKIASTTYESALALGGIIPYTVIREVSENFIHARFKEITVSVLDRGCTIRFADQGPGISDKEHAQLPGFSSATSDMKDYIRGVGSGLPIVKEYLKFSNGRLVIEDNIADGTVITIAVDRNATGQQPVIYQESYAVQQQPAMSVAATRTAANPAMQPATAQAGLEERELDILALATEMSVGPTDVMESLGIPNATAYRLLKKLQDAGYLMNDANHRGKRILTQAGLNVLGG